MPRLQWAANIIFQQDLGAPHNRTLGLTQDVTYLAIADRLEIGGEMHFLHETDRFPGRESANELIIGPSVSFKPNRYTVVDLAPLFGCTYDLPRVAAFLTLSFEFGGGESKTPAPLSRGNR